MHKIKKNTNENLALQIFLVLEKVSKALCLACSQATLIENRLFLSYILNWIILILYLAEPSKCN